MPYDKLSDLPGNVKDNLPKHAQEIFQAAFIVEPLLKCYSVRLVQPTTVVLALVCLVPLLILIDYNSASEQYEDESRQFATAWAAVENVYHKNDDGRWVKKPDHKQPKRLLISLRF